jgi:hypothetical protein
MRAEVLTIASTEQWQSAFEVMRGEALPSLEATAVLPRLTSLVVHERRVRELEASWRALSASMRLRLGT